MIKLKLPSDNPIPSNTLNDKFSKQLFSSIKILGKGVYTNERPSILILP